MSVATAPVWAVCSWLMWAGVPSDHRTCHLWRSQNRSGQPLIQPCALLDLLLKHAAGHKRNLVRLRNVLQILDQSDQSFRLERTRTNSGAFILAQDPENQTIQHTHHSSTQCHVHQCHMSSHFRRVVCRTSRCRCESHCHSR